MHFRMWEDFALKGHGLSRVEEIFQENPWPLRASGTGWAGKRHPSAAKAEAAFWHIHWHGSSRALSKPLLFTIANPNAIALRGIEQAPLALGLALIE